MEATKKLNGKAVGKWLSNNAIIIMMLAVTLIVGIIHPNFFSGTNMINLFKNVSIRYIIALGISGCLKQQQHFHRKAVRSFISIWSVSEKVEIQLFLFHMIFLKF